MKKTGQIFAIIIVSVLSIIHVAIIGDFSKKAFIIDFSIAILIAWLVGRQYDKMKLYTKRMIETEKNYRQLIETIPDAILIYFEGTILYVNEAGKCLLGAEEERGDSWTIHLSCYTSELSRNSKGKIGSNS